MELKVYIPFKRPTPVEGMQVVSTWPSTVELGEVLRSYGGLVGALLYAARSPGAAPILSVVRKGKYGNRNSQRMPPNPCFEEFALYIAKSHSDGWVGVDNVK